MVVSMSMVVSSSIVKLLVSEWRKPQIVVAQRMNKTVNERVRSMRLHDGLPRFSGKMQSTLSYTL